MPDRSPEARPLVSSLDPALSSIALARARGVGPIAHLELCRAAGGPAAALARRIPDAGARQSLLGDAARIVAEARAVGARVLERESDDYPPAVRDLADAPPYLFALGSAGAAAPPAVAIVGTRGATAYGLRVARELAGAFARAGATVVSGLARGVDAAAHEAALAAGGRTVAVLGTGIDVPYPRAHGALHARVAAHGLVLSEHPPGATAVAGSFPRRNRIIAALAELVIVVEAGARSGALITAGHALDLGRTVAAVPGPIDQPSSSGSNELLRDGAALIASIDDALALLSLGPPPRRASVEVSEAARAVLDALAQPAPDVDAVAARSRLPAQRCFAAITELELAGLVECALTGEVRRR